MSLLAVLKVASSITPLAEGAVCLVSGSMRHAFEGFGLEPFRRLTG